MTRDSTAADPAQVAASVLTGEPVALEMEGQPVELAPNEVLVTTQPVEGWPWLRIN